MEANGLCKWSAGLKVQNFQPEHGANSFIHNFNFSVNRRRRIGGVATTSSSPNKRWNPH